MANYNRIKGDYTINTIPAGSNVVLDTSNVQVTGNISAQQGTFSGNIVANYFIGNGSQLTDIAGGPSIANGTSTVSIATANGNVTIDTNGTYTWTFDTTGNINLPVNGSINFNTGGIVQAPDEDFTILVQDADDDGFAIVNAVDDGAGTLLGQTTLIRDEFNIYFPTSSKFFRFTDAGESQLPGNVRWDSYVDQSLYAVADNTGNGTIELRTISYAGDVLGSNVRVTQSNATISTNNAEFTWLFDNTGTLNLPGLTGHIATATDEVNIFSDVDEYNGVTVSNVATNILNQGNVGIVTSSGNANLTWTFDDTGNLTLPGNTFAVNYANGSPVSIGGGSSYGNANVAAYLPTYTGDITANVISATGNIAGDYIIGNGSQLTGLPSGYANSEVATFLASFGSNSISTTGNVTAAFFTGNGAGLTGVIASGNVGSASQLANGTSSLNVPVADGNIVGNISGTANVLILSNTGLQINGDISASGNITGLNINSSNADLAECYRADADYAAGTVVMFGGTAEVTVCNTDSCAQVAGVISAQPAYTMNSGLDSPHVATLALVGRVPCQVQGPVTAGAMMVSAGHGRARAEAAPAMGTVIGKAVQGFDGDIGIVEIVVGRL